MSSCFSICIYQVATTHKVSSATQDSCPHIHTSSELFRCTHSCEFVTLYMYTSGSNDTQGIECDAGFVCDGNTLDKSPCSTEPGYFCGTGGSGPTSGAVCPIGYYCEGGAADKTPCTGVCVFVRVSMLYMCIYKYMYISIYTYIRTYYFVKRLRWHDGY